MTLPKTVTKSEPHQNQKAFIRAIQKFIFIKSEPVCRKLWHLCQNFD